MTIVVVDVPQIESIVAVAMPCRQEALAEVIGYHYKSGCGRGIGDMIGLRVRWLPATATTVRGYKVCWGKKVETTEGTLPFPPNPGEEMYGTVQMGEYRLIEE